MIRKYLVLISLLVMICISIPSLLQANKKLINKAWESMDYMNYSQAVNLLERALVDDPKKKDVRTLMAFAYFKLLKYKNAIKVLEQELELFPESLNAHILLGYINFQHDKLAAAAICRGYDTLIEKTQKGKIKKNLRENPNLALPDFILGIFHKKNEDYGESIRNFRLALERGYDPVACYAQLIDIEFIKENWKMSLTLSQEALDAEGPSPEVFFLMGYGYYHIGEIEKAVINFNNAIELKPYQAESLKNLAKIYYNQDELKLAIPLLKKVHALSPHDYEANFLLKQIIKANPLLLQAIKPKLTKNIIDEKEPEYIYVFKTEINKVLYGMNAAFLNLVKAGQLNSARNLILDFLEICDLSSELNYNLAKLYELDDNLGRALKYAWRAMELKSDYVDVNLNRGSYGRHFATDLGGGSKVARLPQGSKKQKKDNKDVYDLIGSIFFKLEDFPNSLRFYEKVIQIDPDDAMSHYNLGCVLFALKNYGKSEEHWRLTIQNEKKQKQSEKKGKTSPDKLAWSLTVETRLLAFEARKSLGRLYLQRNLKEKALEEFIIAIELVPEDADLHFEVGKIYIELKNSEKANYHFEKYLYLCGKEENVKKILKSKKGEKALFPLPDTT